jgi:formamidase
MRPLPIAALQTAPVFGDPDATLARLRERIPRVLATAPATRLVLLPELYLAALSPPLEESAKVPVDVPGPVTEALGEIARAAGIWLVPGTVYEPAEDGGVHNTCLVFSPDGDLAASYRKVFPWQPHETSVAGDCFTVFDIPDVGRLGLSICYDGSFPETCRELAWMGAEVVLQPTLTTTIDRETELITARANAVFNQLYVVSLNAAAPAGLGRSLIVDPEGIVRYQAGSAEEVITDVLDLDAVTRVREYGTYGVSRMWDQFERRREQLRLSVYTDTVRQ